MPPEHKRKIVAYLKKLGLEQEEAEVYVFLNENGKSTVLNISRGLKTGRTKLYPLLENLAKKQLITIHERHYGTSYEPVSLDALEFLVSDMETRAETMRKALPSAQSILSEMRSFSPVGTRVVEYKGVDGLKQINFNLTKAQGEYRVFELDHLDSHPGMPTYFAEKMRQAQVDNNVISHDLTNNKNWTLQSEVPGLTELSKAAYIDPEVFKISFETYVYNNCVALLNYSADDIFGIEIYSQPLADQQKQLFDLLWGMAQEIDL